MKVPFSEKATPKTWKVLNLYAGIGGNRKLWDNVEVTAVEYDPKIYKIYKHFFPNDRVILGNAHHFLLKHFDKFDFIWSSPPCPTHSRFNNLKKEQMDSGFKPKYPDMKLYEEILLLKQYFNGKFCIENVKSFYEPFITPQEYDNHFFWCNFIITKNNDRFDRGIRTKTIKEKEEERGFCLDGFGLTKQKRIKLLNNCVYPKVGKHILDCARKKPQKTLEMIK